jgi:hypothetical protein
MKTPDPMKTPGDPERILVADDSGWTLTTGEAERIISALEELPSTSIGYAVADLELAVRELGRAIRDEAIIPVVDRVIVTLDRWLSRRWPS